MDLALNQPHNIGCSFTQIQGPPQNTLGKCKKEPVEFVCKYAEDKNPHRANLISTRSRLELKDNCNVLQEDLRKLKAIMGLQHSA